MPRGGLGTYRTRTGKAMKAEHEVTPSKRRQTSHGRVLIRSPRDLGIMRSHMD